MHAANGPQHLRMAHACMHVHGCDQPHHYLPHLRHALRSQARETGICPVREELYAQCFDELIREVTINCAERGLLLLRVRDEMRMTSAAYQVCEMRSDTIWPCIPSDQAIPFER